MFRYLTIVICITTQQVLSKEIGYFRATYKEDEQPAIDQKTGASGMFPQVGSFGNIGSFGNFGNGFMSSGFGGGFGFGGSFGKEGGYVNKNDYDAEKKNANEQDFQKAYGAKGETGGFGTQGFKEGVTAVKDKHADTGFYSGESGFGKQAGDNKEYFGVKSIDEGGKKGEENNAKRGHKKGHTTKGFKTSAHKDEEEKSETFYDEAHDEAEDAHYKGEVGSYGQKEASNFKGGKEEQVFNKQDKGQTGQYEKANILDTNSGEKGQFAQQAHLNNGQAYGVNAGLDAQSILGHQEAGGAEKFYSHKTVPFYGV
ncbi:keratin, type I cytoskeletal 9-like [Chrysoperla carnea]|uniref:keratin, type I cytoskeletal 9-like n=1 Tax=Chrysoperla carnea TaxID=189513 RepID=UPI001D07E01D|nr:keratin, type I cytoskeletal 9-like [Chrysoperla carnea]